MKTKDIIIIGLLIAASFILSNFRIFGSIALDSVPAFLALFVYKDTKAAYIAALGHLITSGLIGFIPMGLVAHLITAVCMYIMMMLAYLLINKTNMIITSIFIIFFNSIISPLLVFGAIGFNKETYLVVVPPLLLATTISIVIAIILTKPIKGVLKYD